MELTIKDLASIVRGQFILGDPKTVVTRAEVDSRRIAEGDLFFALKGERSDGHDYAMAACRSGAKGVVVSRLEWMRPGTGFSSSVIRVLNPMAALQNLGQFVRHGFRGPVVGITGSNGKTTTKQMVAGILKALGPGLATSGNYNSQIGLPLVLSQVEPIHKWMTLEMGASEPGNIHTLCEMGHPTVGVITSIGPAHLETFGSLEKIAETKWELMESLPSKGHAIVPWGVPYLEKHIRPFKKKIVFFGENSACPIRATSISAGPKVQFLLHIGPKTAQVRLPVSGVFNVNNALAAAAVGWVLDCPLEKIVEGLENFEPPKMRMEVSHHPDGATVINDAYNANPGSMAASIRSLVQSYADKRRVLVLGSMLELGESSRKHHFGLGAELGKLNLAKVFLVGEQADVILEGAVSAGASNDKVVVMNDREKLLSELQAFSGAHSVILFKGSRAIGLEDVVSRFVGSPVMSGNR